MHGAGPVGGERRRRRRGLLAEPVHQQQRPGAVAAVDGVAQAVQRQARAAVGEPCDAILGRRPRVGAHGDGRSPGRRRLVPSAGGRRRRFPEELEHDRGHELGLLDVHERRLARPSRFTSRLHRWGRASARCITTLPPLLCPTKGTGWRVVESSTATPSRTSASQLSSRAWSESPWPRWSQHTTRQPASARSGANWSMVPAKSKPPWASSSGAADSSPHADTARRRPCRRPGGAGRAGGRRDRSARRAKRTASRVSCDRCP